MPVYLSDDVVVFSFLRCPILPCPVTFPPSAHFFLWSGRISIDIHSYTVHSYICGYFAQVPITLIYLRLNLTYCTVHDCWKICSRLYFFFSSACLPGCISYLTKLYYIKLVGYSPRQIGACSELCPIHSYHTYIHLYRYSIGRGYNAGIALRLLSAYFPSLSNLTNWLRWDDCSFLFDLWEPRVGSERAK